MERLEIFIDRYNIYKYTRDKGLRLDYIKMVNKLAEGRPITERFVFDARVQDGFDPSRRTHDWMERNGFSVITEPYDPNKQEQKGVDGRMMLNMYKRAARDMYDVALMITGDGDFVPVCEDVQALGKKVEVAAFGETLSSRLRRKADKYHDLMSIASPMHTAHDKDLDAITESKFMTPLQDQQAFRARASYSLFESP